MRAIFTNVAAFMRLMPSLDISKRQILLAPVIGFLTRWYSAGGRMKRMPRSLRHRGRCTTRLCQRPPIISREWHRRHYREYIVNVAGDDDFLLPRSLFRHSEAVSSSPA